MRTLYLLRHSLTEANERHLYGGRTDSPLTAKGRDVGLYARGPLSISGSQVTAQGEVYGLFTNNQLNIIDN